MQNTKKVRALRKIEIIMNEHGIGEIREAYHEHVLSNFRKLIIVFGLIAVASLVFVPFIISLTR